MIKSTVTCKLDDLCERVTKGSTPTSYGFEYKQSGINFVKAENIDSSGNIFRISEFIDEETNTFLNRSILKSNDLLFSIAGTIGRVGIVKTTDLPANTNQALAIIRLISGFLNIRFLFYYLSAQAFRKHALDKIVGVGRANLSLTNLSDFRIELPSRQEQDCINDKIEELFSDLDNAIENLKKAQEQLKVYRQAVLKYAFEGKMTNNASDFKNIALGTVCQRVQNVTKSNNLGEQFLYIDIGCIDNKINKIVCHKKYLWKNAPSRAKQIIKSGDILFSTVRTYLKNIAIVPMQYDGQIGSTGFCVIRPQKDILDSKYIFRYVLWEKFINAISAFQTGTSYPAVRDEDVFSQIILLPNLSVQKRIIEEIESRFSVCDKMEESIGENLQKAEALRQSILKQAFEGNLTEGWRKEHKELISGENSAEALIHKIKNEKEALKNKVKKGKNND